MYILVQASNVNMIYFAFYTITTTLNTVWGGSGYNNGSLIDGSWDCTVYQTGEGFDSSFCTNLTWGYCNSS